MDQHESDRLALVAKHTADGIVIYGPDGRIDWVNDAFVRMTGYSTAEAVGARRCDLVHGPYTRTPEFAALVEDLAALNATTAEFATRTRDGAPYWVSLDVRPVYEGGAVVGLIGVERDVSDRRQAEERARQTLRRAESLGVALRHEKQLLSTVLATIPHVVWWKNADLRYVGCNPAFLAWRGLTTQAEIVGRLESQLGARLEARPKAQADGDAADSAHRDGAGIAAQLAGIEARLVETGQPVVDVTVVVGGTRPRTFLVSVMPHLADGCLAGLIGVGADVSQLTELERQLAQASRLESIGQLAAGIAHEINTPVQYICDNTRFVADSFTGVLAGLASIDELTRGDLTPDGVEQLRAVVSGMDLGFVGDEVPSALSQSLEGLDRVAQIVKAMKDFSHPGSGCVPSDLNRAVETTVQVSRNEWKYVAELELSLDPRIGQVPCYEGELKQALLNMVVNAAHAVQERRTADPSAPAGLIGVRTELVGQEVVITVQDNGIGMDDATRARIFDPFFTTKDVGHGTGQGLSTAHATVVQKHGGRIEVTSAPGVGTTFTVALPLAAPGETAPGSESNGSDTNGAAQ